MTRFAVTGRRCIHRCLDRCNWLVGTRRTRRQSIRDTGDIRDFDQDLFEHLKVVDGRDSEILPAWSPAATGQNMEHPRAGMLRIIPSPGAVLLANQTCPILTLAAFMTR